MKQFAASHCFCQCPSLSVSCTMGIEFFPGGWTVRGLNPGGGEIFRTCPDRPWGPPILLYNGYRVFPGGKERQGREANPSPLSSAVIMKEQSCTSTPSMCLTACTETQCLYKGELYLFLPFLSSNLTKKILYIFQ